SEGATACAWATALWASVVAHPSATRVRNGFISEILHGGQRDRSEQPGRLGRPPRCVEQSVVATILTQSRREIHIVEALPEDPAAVEVGDAIPHAIRYGDLQPVGRAHPVG